MDSPFEDQFTSILNRLESSSEEVQSDLVALIYAELKQLARSQMARQAEGHTLQPTALVNEVWMRVRPGEADKNWKSRRHFFQAAVLAMRSVLVDHARAKLAEKRGGGEGARCEALAPATEPAAKPRPRPSRCVVKKGSNMRLRASLDIPTPVSCTSIVTY